MCHKIFFLFFPQSLKKVKTILSLWAIQKQTVGCSLPIPVLGTKKCLCCLTHWILIRPLKWKYCYSIYRWGNSFKRGQETWQIPSAAATLDPESGSRAQLPASVVQSRGFWGAGSGLVLSGKWREVWEGTARPGGARPLRVRGQEKT